MLSRKYIFLINPHSGTQKFTTVKATIQTFIHNNSLDAEILETLSSGNYDLIHDKIISERVTHIVIGGGDGTIHGVVNALFDLPVQFGILPLGSGNGLARTLGIPMSLQKAMELILNGKSVFIDAIEINNKLSLNVSGLGFDASIAEDFAGRIKRGLLTYTQQSLVQFFKAHPYQFEIQVFGMNFFTDAFLISIANSTQFGNNFTIAPKASLIDGLLDVVIVQKMNKIRLPFAMLQQIRGNNHLTELVEKFSNQGILYFQTPSITIINRKHAPFHIDGDPYPASEKIHAAISGKKISIIQPL